MRRRSASSTSTPSLVDVEPLADAPARARRARARSRRRSRSPRARSRRRAARPASSMATLALKTKTSSPSSTIGSALDVVLVANLADELLDDVLDGDEAGGAAVLVDDDRQLDCRRWNSRSSSTTRLVSGDERSRPHDARSTRSASGAASAIGSGPSRRRDRRCCPGCPCRPAAASTPARGTRRRSSSSVASARNRDDVGPRRHDFAHQRVAEVHDRAQQPALLVGRRCSSSRARRRRRCRASLRSSAVAAIVHRAGARPAR